MNSVVAIIPARGGSKRIPRKNVKTFRGRPAIGWPIEAALTSGLFERVVVSTDDLNIAEISVQLGAQTPFVRDAVLADDHSGTTEVIRDAVLRLNLRPDVPVCCIYATAIFITPDDLITGYQHLQDGADWVLTVGEYPTPIDRAYRREGNCLVARHPEMMSIRSQDLEPAYYDAGQFYWATAARWLDPCAHMWDGAAGVLLPAERAVDIDTPDDWVRAELLAALMDG